MHEIRLKCLLSLLCVCVCVLQFVEKLIHTYFWWKNVIKKKLDFWGKFGEMLGGMLSERLEEGCAKGWVIRCKVG